MGIRRFRHLAAPAALAGLAIVLAACAGPRAPEDEAQGEVASTPLLWPAPPEPARIAWTGAFSRAEDLGIRRGFWRALGDVLFGASNQRLIRPMAVVELRGIVYVADPGAKAVHRFDRGESRHDLIVGPGGTPLASPVGLARCGADIVVTDSALRAVFVIHPGAEEAERMPLSEPVRQPTGVACSADGASLFVVDTAAHRVLRFDRDGRLAGQFGSRGSEPGAFNFPTYLWRSADDKLYIADALNFRVQAFAMDGRFIGAFGRQGDGGGDFARQKGIATDRGGHLYVVDALFATVQIFTPEGHLLLDFGEAGQRRGEFWLPAGLFIGDDDTIYVADMANRRVQTFRYVGGAG
jgi:DNA-binding beta-propeller fold protein YncE